MNEFIIKAADLHKVYYRGSLKVEALRGVDLEVKRGGSILITGPSGAGKSTLLHVLGGLLSPTVGNVYFDDTNLYGISDAALAKIRNKRVGFVFQLYHLLPEFNALENVMLPAVLGGVSSRQKAESLLDMVGLKDRLRHKPAELSGGEAQRVAIARALINDPDIILCDEPTGNLDSKMGSLIYRLLWRINKEENKTLIVVSHSEMMREDFGSIYYIEDGRMHYSSCNKVCERF